MGRSLHNRIRLKRSRLALLNTDTLRSVAVKASASIGLIILAVKCKAWIGQHTELK